MRYVLLLIAMPFGIWVVPGTEVPRQILQEIEVIPLDAPPNILMSPGADRQQIAASVFAYAVPPAIRQGPVVPDWPVHLAPVALDTPVSDTVQVPPGPLGLSAVRPAGGALPAQGDFDLRVSGNRVHMRAGPGTSHAILQTLRLGAPLRARGTMVGGWRPVELVEGGRRGWVFGRYLR